MKLNAFGFALLAALTLALTAVACGNYSNDDLEYMSVVPQPGELSSNLPQTRGAIELANAAELYRTTHNVSDSLNGLLDNLLSLIETVRRFSPTSRTPNSRTWGPFPARDQPGWLAAVQITRDVGTGAFTYWVGFIPAIDPHAAPLHVIEGSFQIGGTLRQGKGTVNVMTAAARAAGIDLKMGFLDHLETTYDIVGPTVSVFMTITNLPNPLKPTDALKATYDYGVVADGRGGMTFDFWADAVPGPLGTEHLRITSRWLANGAGRGEAEIVEGDGAGARQSQCWGSSFQSTYNNKPWMPGDNSGDPGACPDIPSL